MRNLCGSVFVATLIVLLVGLESSSSSPSLWAVSAVEVAFSEEKLQSWVDGVKANSDDAMAWAALGLNLPIDRTVKLPAGEEGDSKKEKDFNKVDVLVRALNIDPLHAESWANLANAMKQGNFNGPDNKVKIDDQDYTHLEVLAHALSMDEGVAAMWINLGVELVAQDNRKIRQTKQGQLKPQPTEQEVDGVSYTATKCFVNALGINPKEGRAWINLAIALPDSEETLEDKSVQNALILLNDEHDRDDEVPAELDRTTLLLVGLELSPDEVEGWRALGNSLNTRDEKVKKVTFHPRTTAGFKGGNTKKQIDSVNCFEKALTLDPTHGNTWFSLAASLSGKQAREKRSFSAMVSGQSYGEKEAAAKALHCPNLEFRRKAWLNLGMSLDDVDEEIVVFNVPYKKQDCYVKAVSKNSIPTGQRLDKEAEKKYAPEEELSDKEMSEAWTLVSTTLGLEVDTHETEGDDMELKKRKKSTLKGGDLVKVDGKKYRAKDCYAESLSYDSENCKAWTNIGASLKRKSEAKGGKPDTIMVGPAGGKKKAYNEQDAYLEAIKCSEGKDGKAWANLALGMGSMDTVGPVPGFPVPVEEGTEGKLSKVHCIVKALEVETQEVIDTGRDPKCRPPPKDKMNKLWKPKRNVDLSNLWMTLATTIEPTTTVTMFDDLTAGDGTSVDEKQLKKNNRKAYDKLQESKQQDAKNKMAKGQNAKSKKARKEMDGQEYNKIDCFAMSARYNPKYAAPYLSMALMMKPEDEEGEDHESGEGGMFINGKTYNRIAMVKRALELEPDEERAWAVLYLMMDPKKVRGEVPETVTINHKKYDLDAVRKKAGKFGKQIDEKKPAQQDEEDL